MNTTRTYARTDESPRVIDDEHSPFFQQAKLIATWAGDPPLPERLQIGGIWGDRGSGKTSMLLTVHELLKRAARTNVGLPISCDEDAADSQPLFEATKLSKGDDLLFALLEFFGKFYFQDLPTPTPQEGRFRKIYRIQAEHKAQERFLKYQEDTAVSAQALVENAVSLYRELSMRGTKIRGYIKDAFSPLVGSEGERDRLVVLVDDMDLAPSRAYELLTVFHQFFQELPITVLVGADPELLSQAVAHELSKSGVGSIALAHKIVAKHIVVNWRLPVPTPHERWEIAWDGIATSTNEGGFAGEVLWRDFVRRLSPPQLPSHVEGERAPWYEEEEDGPEPLGKDRAVDFLVDAMPRTWRGANRFYNRFVDEAQAADDRPESEFPGHKTLMRLTSRNRDKVQCNDDSVAGFVAIIHALDESFPELHLLTAFEEEPQALYDALTHEDGPRAPVLDRLELIDDSRRARVRRQMRTLGQLWEALRDPNWREDNHVHNGTFLAVSGRGDAKASSNSWWSDVYAADKIVHLDIRGPNHSASTRPSAVTIRKHQLPELTAGIDRTLSIEEGGSARPRPLCVHVSAPLALAAWLGHALGREKLLLVLSERIRVDEINTPTYDVFRGVPTTALPAGGATRLLGPTKASASAEFKGKASVLVSTTETHAGSSSHYEPLPFLDADGNNIELATEVVLRPYQHFELTRQNQVIRIVEDIRSILSNLREEGATEIHLAFQCPSALAVLIGQHLHSFAPVFLYEYSGDQPKPCYEHITIVG